MPGRLRIIDLNTPEIGPTLPTCGIVLRRPVVSHIDDVRRALRRRLPRTSATFAAYIGDVCRVHRRRLPRTSPMFDSYFVDVRSRHRPWPGPVWSMSDPDDADTRPRYRPWSTPTMTMSDPYNADISSKHRRYHTPISTFHDCNIVDTRNAYQIPELDSLGIVFVEIKPSSFAAGKIISAARLMSFTHAKPQRK